MENMPPKCLFSIKKIIKKMENFCFQFNVEGKDGN